MYLQAPADPQATKLTPSAPVSKISPVVGGRVYRYLQCQECGSRCIDSLVSGHIYQSHIRRKDAVQCPYCDYGVTYAAPASTYSNFELVLFFIQKF